jgi:hypothetical protein
VPEGADHLPKHIGRAVGKGRPARDGEADLGLEEWFAELVGGGPKVVVEIVGAAA